ncbi:heme A synthase COX15-like [Oscarella lobularis]|uniref:heme A synthase COX15-like n=1 Tax=Oscarella lobularis TaxID=121494 RepID=UPI003313C119
MLLTSFLQRQRTQIWFSIRQAAQQTRRVLVVNARKSGAPNRERGVGIWLMGCCGMVVGSVVLGGVTRLTESGLSMVDWHLVKGIKPPTNEEEWKNEFEKYKQYPEFKYVHQTMTLDEFKRIFYMEYSHRMWGRCVGIVFALPATYFWLRGKIPRWLKPRIIIYGGLLLFQGLLGWYMVKSGLKQEKESLDIPRVSQYRLAAHLGSALLLYSLLFWSGLEVMLKGAGSPANETRALVRLRHATRWTKAIVFLTALSGAFVAGLDAGLVYNSFPKMANRWIPDDLFAMEPKWRNLFENATTVQFNHRLLGTIALSSIAWVWVLARPLALAPRARLAVNCLAGMAFIQVSLGIGTLLFYVPISLAAAHQSGSLLLLTFSLWLSKELARKRPRL